MIRCTYSNTSSLQAWGVWTSFNECFDAKMFLHCHFVNVKEAACDPKSHYDFVECDWRTIFLLPLISIDHAHIQTLAISDNFPKRSSSRRGSDICSCSLIRTTVGTPFRHKGVTILRLEHVYKHGSDICSRIFHYVDKCHYFFTRQLRWNSLFFYLSP